MGISNYFVFFVFFRTKMGNNEAKFKEIFEDIDTSGDKKLCFNELDNFLYQLKALSILRDMNEHEQSNILID